MQMGLSLHASKKRVFGVLHLQNSCTARQNTSGHVNSVPSAAQEILFHSTVPQTFNQAA